MRTLVLIALVAMAAALPAEALLVELTDPQVEQAMAHGKATYERWKKGGQPPVDDLDPEYIVDLGKEIGRAAVYTEFATVALEMRRHLAIERPFKPEDAEAARALLRGKVEFHVILIVPDRDSLLRSTARLTDSRGEHRAVTENVGRGMSLRDRPGRFVVAGRYTFDARSLDVAAPVTLVIETPTKDTVRFPFDLTRLR